MKDDGGPEFARLCLDPRVEIHQVKMTPSDLHRILLIGAGDSTRSQKPVFPSVGFSAPLDGFSDLGPKLILIEALPERPEGRAHHLGL